jgi:hypothetical protein
MTAQSSEDLCAKVTAQTVEGKPTLFRNRSQLKPREMIRIGAGAFDEVDRHGRIAPDASELRGGSAENKQVEPIMSERWFG